MNFKHLLCFSLLTISLNSFAQVNYGVKAGIGLPTWSHKNQEYDIDIEDYDGKYFTSKTSSITSFYVNAYAEYKMKCNFALQGGVSLEGRGGKLPEVDYKARYFNVNIPVNVLYYIPTGDLGSTFISVGPYAGINFGGKYTAGDGEGGTFTEKMVYGESPEIKRFDWGLNFGLGYKFTKGYLINVNYNLGLQNMGTQGPYEKLHSRGFSFGIGYEF